ncbi:hypothetical protein AVEN_12537-1, partial [Araneus ventricosus]
MTTSVPNSTHVASKRDVNITKLYLLKWSFGFIHSTTQSANFGPIHLSFSFAPGISEWSCLLSEAQSFGDDFHFRGMTLAIPIGDWGGTLRPPWCSRGLGRYSAASLVLQGTGEVLCGLPGAGFDSYPSILVDCESSG